MIINISRLQTYMTCPRKYKAIYEDNLVPEGVATPLIEGTAIHAALERLYLSGGLVESALADLDNAYNEALEGTPEDAEALEGRRSYSHRMIEDYAKKYIDADLERYEIIASEEAWTAHVGDHVIPCRLDLVVLDRHDNQYKHMQHKTMGHTVSPDKYVRDYDLAFHEPAYAIAATERGLTPWGGTTLNLLRKTKVPSFFRFEVPVDSDRITSFIEDFLVWVSLIESDIRPRNPGACMKWNRLCFHHDRCIGLDFGQTDLAAREPDYVDDLRKETI